MKVMKKMLACLLLLGCSSKEYTIPELTVMITNLSETGGGSGAILTSQRSLSTILTNSHVCKVVRNGGLVHTKKGKFFVLGFKESSVHDLCLISVAENLGVSTKIASREPAEFEEVLVSGHPKLLPTIMTNGHLSEKRIIQVLGRIRPCTAEDAMNKDTASFCFFLGGVPVLTTYEAIAVSATIQPGSSGSAVFSKKAHIVAVIFAGEGSFGYGYAVPYEYVHNFVTSEVATLPFIPVTSTVDATSTGPQSHDFRNIVKAVCGKETVSGTAEFCEEMKKITAIDDLIYRK